MQKKKCSLLTWVIPLTISLLIGCVTAGYLVYRHLNERAYRKRWEDYNDCGFA
ncbi:MAG: hypothetical protein HFG20_01700 [Anaerotruncus sp.]|jgi:hypothetical protein|nr:hypothetical protein [Anaerotruncus sp.]